MCLTEVIASVNQTIQIIEQLLVNQKSLNKIYLEIKYIFIKEISNLPDKRSKYKNTNQKRTSGKPQQLIESEMSY